MPDEDLEQPRPATQVSGQSVQDLLDGLQDRPVGEHVVVFEAVHRILQGSLATLDQA